MLCLGSNPLPFVLPQPKPAVIAAALHLPAAPAGTHCQQQQTGSPTSRHQHLGKSSAACENGEQGEKRDCKARHQDLLEGEVKERQDVP